MKKIILGVVVLVLVLLVAAVFVVAVFLNGIVKRGVETAGPKITGVSINLDDVHIVLYDGSAKVKGLVVGNPEGYKTTNAISVGVAEVAVDPLSILSGKIVMHSVHIVSPEITFEGGFGGNNLSKIMENVNAVAKAGGPPATNTTVKAAKPAKKIEVDDFLLSGAKVHVTLNEMGGRQMTIPLPDIHLTNLGRSGGGLTSTELTRTVLQAVNIATVKAVSKAASGLDKDAAGIGVNKIKTGIGGLMGK